jgi:predicted Fe-Mo cluster-binding NifX family protein
VKIAISASQPTEKSLLESRFGRASWFMVYDDLSKTWESIENKVNLDAAQGAGIQTAQMLAEKGVNAVIVGFCGPKAFRVLQEAGIRVFMDVEGNIEEAVDAFLNNRIVASESANAAGHW